MKISIEYCSVWNYLPKASSLEANIRKKFKIEDINLIPSSGGVFEVQVNNELIFSKKALGRHPDSDEIEKIIQKKLI